MIALPLCGAALGAALFWLLVALRPPKQDPLVALGRFYAAREQPSQLLASAPSSPRQRGLQRRLGATLARTLSSYGIRATSLRQDLALTGEGFDLILGRKVLLAVGGFLFGLLIVTAMGTAGVPVPRGAALGAGLVLAGPLFMVPDIDAHRAATVRRAEFRRALGAYLDWVSLQMSGRAAAEQALPDAARIGGGWPLAVIRHTVAGATRSGTDVWLAFADLGQRIGVAQLQELGALVRLVAHDGAQVRDTLSARAASLRAEELADARGAAGKRDQSMLLAQILLGVGFAVFLGYPAVVNFMRL